MQILGAMLRIEKVYKRENDRLSDLLEEAANRIELLESQKICVDSQAK